MMINKNRFRVSNDKKVLHKIGKRWVTVSALTLALLGGAAAASTVTTHAAGVQSAPTEKVAEQPAQNATPKNIMSAASNMHQGMLTAAPKSVAPSASASAKPNSASQSASSVSSRRASSAVSSVASGSSVVSSSSVNNSSASSVSNKASGNQTSSASSASAKSSVNSSTSNKPAVHMLDGGNPLDTQAPKTIQQATDTNWIWTNNGYVSDTHFTDWKTNQQLNESTYYGLNWKYSPTANAVEFTKGTLNWNWYSHMWSAFIGIRSNAPKELNNANSITFGDNVDTTKVTDLRWMFYNDTSLKSLVLPNSFNTSNINNMDAMFHGDSNLQSLKLSSNFNTTKVTDMGWMFQSDKSLHSITLPQSFNTSNVDNMGYMFASDTNLRSLNLGANFDTSNVTNMNDMFQSMPNLQSLDLGKKFNTSKVTNMAGMFQNLNSLQSLNLGSEFDTSNVTNMNSMFDSIAPWSSKGGLHYLNLGNKFNTSKVTNMSYMFFLNNLSNINLGPHFDTSNVTDMSYMFEHSGNIKSLNLGKNFHTYKVTNMAHMFTGISAKSLNLGSDFNTSNVTNMGSMFSDASLNTINFGSKFNTSKVSQMQHMFDSDYNMQKLVLPNNFNTSNVSNMYQMFINIGRNTNGTNLTLDSNFDTTKAINSNNKGVPNYNGINGVYYMFYNAKLGSLTIPRGTRFRINKGSYLMPLYQTTGINDSTGKPYTLNTPTDFTKGNHVGVFMNKNVAPVSNIIAFTDNKTNDLVGSTTAYGTLDSSYTIPTAPKGYSFINNDNTFKIVSPDTKVSIPVAKSNTADNANKDIPVAPTQDTDTIDYQYNGNTKGSQTFTGNDQHATDAGDNSIDVDSKAATKMPAGYQLVNKDNSVPYDNGTHNVAITPIQQTDNIQFMNNGHQVGTTTTKGNDSRTGINGNSTATLPTGYQLAKGASASVINNGQTHQINVTPIQKTDTIDYQLDGVTKGSNQFTGNDSQANGATGTSFDVNSSNDAGIPQGYQLVNKDNRFNYDGDTHNVAIEATDQSAKVNYNLSNGTNISNGTISGTVNGKATPNQAPQGYHFVGNVAPYTFTTANAGNNPSDNVTVAPNTYNGTATVHIKYDLGNGDIVNSTDQHVNVHGRYGQSDQVISSTDYCPMNDAYQDHNANWLIDFNDLTKNGSVNNGKLEHTFTYNATAAPSLVIRYDLIDQSNDKLVKKDIHDDTFTASQLGIKPQDWVVGSTITLGTKKNGDTNRLDVISAPQGYHLVDNANGYDYKNATESIQLEPNATVSGHPVVLMAMPMFFHRNQSNKPVTPSSASTKPSSAASSVAPSSASASVAPSSASQSTSSSAPARQIIDHGSIEPSGNTPEPVNTPTSTPSNKPSDVTPANQPSDVAPVVHKHTTKPSVQKNTQPSDQIVNKNAGKTKAESKPLVEPSRHMANVQHEAQNHMANLSNKMAQPTVHVANIHASRISNAKRSANVQHKLPQTNEAKAAGLMGAASIMAALGLAGADVRKKHYN